MKFHSSPHWLQKRNLCPPSPLNSPIFGSLPHMGQYPSDHSDSAMILPYFSARISRAGLRHSSRNNSIKSRDSSSSSFNVSSSLEIVKESRIRFSKSVVPFLIFLANSLASSGVCFSAIFRSARKYFSGSVRSNFPPEKSTSVNPPESFFPIRSSSIGKIFSFILCRYSSRRISISSSISNSSS